MPEQQIHTHVFPNGLTLLVEPMADVQSASFSLLVPCGSNYDPVGQEGSASILCDWLIRGAGERDSVELTNALDNLGLQRNEGVGNSHLSLAARRWPAIFRRRCGCMPTLCCVRTCQTKNSTRRDWGSSSRCGRWRTSRVKR